MEKFLLISGYFRSGTTWVRNVLASDRRVGSEPDVVDVDYGKLMQQTYGSEDVDEDAFRVVLKNHRKFVGFKFNRGALRWKKYRALIEDVNGDSCLVYVIRHLRGVVASHYYRRFPTDFDGHGTDVDGVNGNMAAAINDGWPHNSDNGLFAELLANAGRSASYAIAVQWLAHIYEGVASLRDTDLLTYYEQLCLDEDEWPRVLGGLRIKPNARCKRRMRNTSAESRSRFNGREGIDEALGRQREHGALADDTFAFVGGLAEKHGSETVGLILGGMEQWRV